MFEILALVLEIVIAVFFAFKSLQAYDRYNNVRVFVYGAISVCLSFTYVYYAAWAEKMDIFMSIAMSGFMFMVAYPIVCLKDDYGTFSRSGEDPEIKEQRLEKLNEPLPMAAPLPYKIFRGLVQHFPYRIALVAFGVYVYFWHMDSMTVTSTLIFLGYWILALINGIHPFMTRPLRYRLITAVDGMFQHLYTLQEKRRTRSTKAVCTRDDVSDD